MSKVFVIMSSILLQFKRFFITMNHILNYGNEKLQYKNVACTCTIRTYISNGK